MQNTEQLNLQIETQIRRRLRFYDKEKINWISLPESARMNPFGAQIFVTAGLDNVLTVDEYMDYVEVEHGETLELRARDLAIMCASAYNCMVGSAMQRFGWGVYVTDLLTNNLTINYRETGPSICDPAGLIKGYLTYRFGFAAGLPSQVKSSSPNRTATGAVGRGLNAVHQVTTPSRF